MNISLNANRPSGFSMVELMIVVAIIAILAALAMPQFQNQLQRTKFTEVILATNSFKSAIEICTQTQASTDFKSCATSTNGVPALPAAYGNLSSLAWDTDKAELTATGTSEVGDHTYILTGAIAAGRVTWQKSGTCVAAALC